MNIEKIPSDKDSSDLEKFFSLDESYRIKVGQIEGEEALAKIAVDAEQEYGWLFDETKSIWAYEPPKSTHETVDLEKRKAQMGAKLSPVLSLLSGSMDSPILYHIHPDKIILPLVDEEKDGPYSENFLLVKNNLPSSEDISEMSKLYKIGVKESRIVTSLGVTTMILNPENVTGGSRNFSGFTIPEKAMVEALEEGGIENAINEILRLFNEHFGEVFTFSFRKI